MAGKTMVPWWVRAGNLATVALLRAGVPLKGFGYPMYLLTVRGRRSGEPRTVPIVIMEQGGARYLSSPYGVVDWVRNLRAAGAATLARGGRSEAVLARELPPPEGGLVLRESLRRGNPFASYFGVAPDSPAEAFERAAAGHPVFVLEEGRRG